MEKYKSCLIELSNSSFQNCTPSRSCEDIFLRGIHTGSQLLKQAFYHLAFLRVIKLFKAGSFNLIQASCRSDKISQSEVVLASETLSNYLSMEFQVSYHKRYCSTQDRLQVLEQSKFMLN